MDIDLTKFSNDNNVVRMNDGDSKEQAKNVEKKPAKKKGITKLNTKINKKENDKSNIVKFPSKKSHNTVKAGKDIRNERYKFEIYNPSDIKEEKNSRLTSKIFFEFSPQETVNMLDALALYKKLILPDLYKPIVDLQIDKIVSQLKLQEIDIYSSDDEKTDKFEIGDNVIIDDYDNLKKGIIISASPTDGFLNIVIAKNNELEVIEVPRVLIKKVNEEKIFEDESEKE